MEDPSLNCKFLNNRTSIASVQYIVLDDVNKNNVVMKMENKYRLKHL